MKRRRKDLGGCRGPLLKVAVFVAGVLFAGGACLVMGCTVPHDRVRDCGGTFVTQAGVRDVTWVQPCDFLDLRDCDLECRLARSACEAAEAALRSPKTEQRTQALADIARRNCR